VFSKPQLELSKMRNTKMSRPLRDSLTEQQFAWLQGHSVFWINPEDNKGGTRIPPDKCYFGTGVLLPNGTYLSHFTHTQFQHASEVDGAVRIGTLRDKAQKK
jgi:hypothetical protein